ncbi:MAG: hypothetical protein K8I03_01490 [Ignavibacteria bacterium]|nr:hypothetical protein [Ignavibacteria bacterium]
MKTISKQIAFVILLSVCLFSCGNDDKKTEYVEDGKDVKTEQKKPDEVKQESGSTSANDSAKQNNSTGSKDYSKSKDSFQNEKPVAEVSPLDAANYNGRTVVVKGFVADIYQSEKVAYLNFVEKYPDNPFTAVIFASKFDDFPDIGKFKGKNVEVTGRVSNYKGKPQIILNSPKQIVVK